MAYVAQRRDRAVSRKLVPQGEQQSHLQFVEFTQAIRQRNLVSQVFVPHSGVNQETLLIENGCGGRCGGNIHVALQMKTARIYL
jgi:hypothetical protein